MSSKKEKPKPKTSSAAKSPYKKTPAKRAIAARERLTLVQQLVDLPRSWRIVMVAMFSMAVVAALFPLVDGTYLRFFYTRSTVILPALVTAFSGLVMWGVGWWVLVGWAGEQPKARPAVLWYFIVGTVFVLLVLFLLIQGAVIGMAEN